MSHHGEFFKKAQAELEVARAEMHERNLKHMEELANILPTPSPNELRVAMGLEPLSLEAEMPKPIVVVSDDPPKTTSDDKVDDKVEKTSKPEPAAADSKADYKTRASQAKR
jgi:hypothetical protein